MPQFRTPFSQLNPKDLKLLTMKITAYALRKLGNRIGAGPAMDPKDLTQRAILDTLEGRRKWNLTRYSIEQHLIGCINSYISHYFDSKEARTPRMQWPGPDNQDYALGDKAWDHRSPETIISNKDLMESVRKMIVNDGDPNLYQIWQRVEHSDWDLDQDLEQFCIELGFDSETGSAGYQRFNRLRKKIRMYAQQCYEDESSHTPQTH